MDHILLLDYELLGMVPLVWLQVKHGCVEALERPRVMSGHQLACELSWQSLSVAINLVQAVEQSKLWRL